MVGEYEQYLYFPLFVAVAGSLVVYLFQLWLQRATIRDALLSEINLILAHAKETYDYLSQTDHYWLQANQVIKRAPTDTKLTTSTFVALLPQAHLLGRSGVVRILHFYAHYERCENLKVSLFKHVWEHADSKVALTESDVRLLNIRRKRLCEGYLNLIGSRERVIQKLSDLSAEYSIPSTKDIASKINLEMAPQQSPLPTSETVKGVDCNAEPV